MQSNEKRRHKQSTKTKKNDGENCFSIRLWIYSIRYPFFLLLLAFVLLFVHCVFYFVFHSFLSFFDSLSFRFDLFLCLLETQEKRKYILDEKLLTITNICFVAIDRMLQSAIQQQLFLPRCFYYFSFWRLRRNLCQVFFISILYLSASEA